MKLPFRILVPLLGLFCLVVGTEAVAQRKGKTRQERTATQPSQPSFRPVEEGLTIEGMKYMMMDAPARALPLFEQLIEKSPGDPAGHYLKSQALHKLNRTEEAILSLQKARTLDPGNQYYTYTLAERYGQLKNYAEAIKLYEQLLAQQPDNSTYGLELATMYVFNDQYDKAINTYNLLEKQLGISEEITHQKQQLYLRLNKLDKAIDEARKLADHEPSEGEYKIQLAELLIAAERLDQAILPLEEALRLNPDEAQAHVLLADIYRRKGDVEKCSKELAIVFSNPNIDAEPKLRVLAGYLTLLESGKALDEALQLTKQLIDTHPNDARTQVMYADLLVRQGKKTEARDSYVKAARLDGSSYEMWGAILQLDGELNQVDSLLVHSDEALELFPNQGFFWYSNGSANLIKRNYKRAIAAFEESLRLVTNNPELTLAIYAQMGDAYNGAKNYPQSDTYYDKVLKEDPENDHVLNNYSYFLSLRKEKLDLAMQMSERLVKRNPTNATFLDTHAWVLYVRKDYKQARYYLEKAMESNPSVSGTITEHYGDVLFQLGEKAKALEYWNKAKALGGGSEFLEKKITTGQLYE